IDKVWIEDENKNHTEQINEESKEFYVNFTLKAKENRNNIVPGVIITNEQGEFIVAENSIWAKDSKNNSVIKGKNYLVRFKVKNIFEQGNYGVSVNVVSEDLNIFYAW